MPCFQATKETKGFEITKPEMIMICIDRSWLLSLESRTTVISIRREAERDLLKGFLLSIEMTMTLGNFFYDLLLEA